MSSSSFEGATPVASSTRGGRIAAAVARVGAGVGAGVGADVSRGRAGVGADVAVPVRAGVGAAVSRRRARVGAMAIVGVLVSIGAGALGCSTGSPRGGLIADARSGGDPDARGGGDVDAHPTGAADAAVTPSADAASSIADAPPAAAADPAAAGSYGVHVEDGASVTTPSGAETVTVYAPSLDGGATIAPGKFPLVVVSTGFTIPRTAYAASCTHLASWGYVVISHDYASGNHQDHAAGVSAILDWALGAAGLGAHVDPARIATAGHSMGGKVSILTAVLDARVKAVVAWDPVDALPPIADGSYSVTPEKMSQLKVPTVFIGETTDGGTSGGGFGTACAPVDDNYHQYFSHACQASSALEVTITGADHTEFVDDAGACGLACLLCTKGTTGAAAVQTITWRVTVAWLEAHLKGTAGMSPWLTAPQIGTPAVVTAVTGC